MGILGSMVVLRISLGISFLVLVVVRHFGFGFDSGFAMVEQFYGGYVENEVVFGNGCFEKIVESSRRRRHTEDFG